jgi:hypothetical protein
MHLTDEQIYDIARVCHDANRAWCKSAGDHSQSAWEAAPSWQQDSAINGARFLLENPDASLSAQHENWMAEKIANGWVHGTEKNPDATPPTHPCLVPYDQLPEHQRKKDALFCAIVKALA